MLSVDLIKTVRAVNHKKVTDTQAYALELFRRPDLKEFTEYEYVPDGVYVWVRGEEALPSFWMPRGKPKR